MAYHRNFNKQPPLKSTKAATIEQPSMKESKAIM
ncbi:hypothetical protein V6Z12_D07G108300 [Gossypium hirsutum]